MINNTLDIQGHRGCRGLYPENSIPAFLHAIDLGVTTLECDAVISKDHKVILSHEPFMSHEICVTPAGDSIIPATEHSHNIYALNYEQIKDYDCGSAFVTRFPNQKKLPTHKPSLEDVVKHVNQALSENGLDFIYYNLEIKRKKEWDFTHHPDYQTFADIVIEQVNKLGIMPYTTIQCFDIETLQYIHKKYPRVKLVYLIENDYTPEANMDVLGFIPEVYSPYYKLVDTHLVDFCASKKMKLIPWTVNDAEDIKHMINLEVDGIISDYPDRLINIYRELKP
jgi:glycerophosphoryl diester phosphodiesterase